MNKQIAIHLADGFEEIEAVSIIDVLRRAELNVVLVSISGKSEVTGAHQLTVMADVLFEQVNYDEVDMIILPGGMPGATNLNAHEGLKGKITMFHEAKKALAAICAAPMVFGNLGILGGRQAVCYPGFEKYLAGAEVLDSPVASSGHIITGRGVGAALKFALTIVEKMVSAEKAEVLKKQMLID